MMFTSGEEITYIVLRKVAGKPSERQTARMEIAKTIIETLALSEGMIRAMESSPCTPWSH